MRAYEIINLYYILAVVTRGENDLYEIHDYRNNKCKVHKDINLNKLQGVIYNLDFDENDKSCFKRTNGKSCKIDIN